MTPVLIIVLILIIIYRIGNQASEREESELRVKQYRNYLKTQEKNKERQTIARDYTSKFKNLILNLESELKHASREKIKDHILSMRNKNNPIESLFYNEVITIIDKRKNSKAILIAKDNWFIFPLNASSYFDFFIKIISSELKSSITSEFKPLSNSKPNFTSESNSNVIKESLLKACDEYLLKIEHVENENKKQQEKRRQLLNEQKRYEKTLFLNNKSIKLEARYSESKNLYLTSIILAKKNPSIINLALEMDFKQVNSYSEVSLKKDSSINKHNIDQFFTFWQYNIISIIENQKSILNNIKYQNYFDDNQYISYDYFSFDFLNHSWHFNLSLSPSFTILSKGESPHNNYKLRRSSFGPNSISKKNFILAQYIIASEQSTLLEWLALAKEKKHQKTILTELINPNEFAHFSATLKTKWNIND